jgi:hypothetical protein
MNVGHQGFRSYLILIEPLEDILTTVEALHYLLCVALDLDQRSTGEMKKRTRVSGGRGLPMRRSNLSLIDCEYVPSRQVYRDLLPSAFAIFLQTVEKEELFVQAPSAGALVGSW